MSRDILRMHFLMRAALSCVLVVAPRFASASEQHYLYSVRHSSYGVIGTYKTSVEKSSDLTIITTEADIKVSVLGIVLYRQEISRAERWSDSRLVSFHSVTTENRHAVEVDGWAERDRFIVVSPAGQTVAPATIRPVSPWSLAYAKSDVILMPDTGEVGTAHISGPREATITVEGASQRVKEYEIDPADEQERYKVWVDAEGTPLIFNVIDRNGTVTFTLISPRDVKH